MDHDGHHEDLIQSVAEEYADILRNSEQGVYIFLDDSSKVCNAKFATLLGYDSPEEWAKVDESFPDAFVDESSQDVLVSAFQDAMEKGVGSTNEIMWKKKDESTVKSTVILAPIAYEGHLLALHFISEKK